MNETRLTGNRVTAKASGPLDDLLRKAMFEHNAGRIGEAEFYCRLILGTDKRQFEALHLLGLIEFQRGRLDEACNHIRRALKSNPRAIHAYANLGLVLQHLDRNEEALLVLNKALKIEPKHVPTLNNKGHVLWRLRRFDEALVSLDRALAVDPRYADALCNRGNVLIELGRFDEAAATYDRALAIQPDDPLTLNNRGNALWAAGRRDDAVRSYDQAAALAPDDPSILKDRGAALFIMGRGEDALACFSRALALNPGDIDLQFKRGKALSALGRLEEALASFDGVLLAQPDHVDALVNRGHVFAAWPRVDEALKQYDAALAIRPELPEAHWFRGCTLLGIGDFEHGWREYEWRSYEKQVRGHVRDFSQPLWLGDQPLEGKTILLHAEQGFGDTLQFVRYVPQVVALGAKVILEVQAPLKSLLSNLKGASLVVGRDERLPPFDLHCPLLSLPLAFNTRLESIPAQTPYLRAAPERVRTWDEQLPKSHELRIGVIWGGNPEFPGDATRSIGLRALAPLLSIPGFQFFSLQKDLRAGDADLLREHPNVVHLGERLTDFGETAAIMSCLDLVISSDTVAVHLAGALRRPVWILLERVPDWRWLVDRNDNPWYPTARIFRQSTHGDWAGVIETVGVELTQWRSNTSKQIKS